MTFGWLAMAAGAQSLEGVLMPGNVIAGHAKFEQQCEKCHVKFSKEAQDGLCLDCHKEVARDVRAKQGFHGRLAPQACRACHTDHKGRDMNIAPVAEKGFDHAKTGFVLAGRHVDAKCASCHVAGKKYRAAPTTCEGCHRKDDKHKGSLGSQCQDCHTESKWKDTARFDHAKTKFALSGKHVDAKCAGCHVGDTFKDAPLTCAGCHRKDDKQHRGRLGEKCETCHVASGWKDVATFAHDRDAHFALRGKHQTAKCESCHKSTAGLIKVPTACNGCHQPDDKHNGTLGPDCGDCHTEKNWKEAKFNHDTSKFRLQGKHRDVDCVKCHKDPASFRGAPVECVACHRKDDTHKGRYAESCGTCHTAVSWKDIVFRHDRDTKYRLVGRHASTKCDACHVGNVYKDKLSSDCYSCHRKDDKHKDQLGQKCEQCHDTEDWKKTVRFDHARSRFPLLGMHLRTECKACHQTPAFKDARRECVACHVKDDRHKGRLGSDCAACHNARSWKIWDFDHTRRTHYPLDGAHVKVACVACHKVPGAPGEKVPALASNCYSCHAADDVHGGNFGGQCERCHTTRSFKDIRAFGSRTAPRSDAGGDSQGSGTLQ